MLICAVISITLALIFYTVGVWSEKIQGLLKKWHVAIFWLGLIFDSLGTILMGKIAFNGFQLNIHGITGVIAIALMVFHSIWATYVIFKNNRKDIMNFHKYSLLVWLIWLIPYASGAIMGMVK